MPKFGIYEGMGFKSQFGIYEGVGFKVNLVYMRVWVFK